MRRGASHRCFAPAQSWVADYLERVGAAPRPSAALPSSCAASPSDVRGKDADGSLRVLTPGEAALLQKKYEGARRAFLKSLGAYPYSYARVVGRPMAPEDEWKLRGLSNDDFMGAIDARREGAEEVPGRDAALTPAKERSAAVVAPAKPLSGPSSATPARSPTHANPPHWPSLLQLTREVERYTMTRSYLWVPSHVNAKAGASLRGFLTTSDAYAATPSLLAFYPFSVLSRVAEHAVRHAWRGDPRLYPGRRTPNRGVAFDFSHCPRLTLEDVASQQWDRAEAAHFLLLVVQHPCIQKDLRQRLWTTAQRYHRDILKDLDSLAHGSDKDGKEEHFIEIHGSRSTHAAAKVPLADVKRQLFSFPAYVHFAVTPPANSTAGRPEKKGSVVLQSLRSSHWFHFASPDRNVTSILSERPRTDIFIPSTQFVEMTKRSSRSVAEQKILTTQDQMWLLISEMSRLRILVAYLLHLEVFLYTMRKAALLSPAGRKTPDGGCDTLQGLTRAEAQEAHDALYVGEVFHFLEMQIHMKLQRRVHNRRFLSKFQMRFEVSDEAHEGGLVSDTWGGDGVSRSGASRTGVNEKGNTGCFSTVQGLFTAFMKALEGDARSKLQESGAADVEADGKMDRKADSDRLQVRVWHTDQANFDTHVDPRADRAVKDTPLSPDDGSFLEAIVSFRPDAARKKAGNVRSSQGEPKMPKRGARYL